MISKLKPHIGHRVALAWYGEDINNPNDITIECLDCNEVLISAETFKDEKNRYTDQAKELYMFYRAFCEAGFTQDQAFELTTSYIRNSFVEWMDGERRRARTRSDREELLRKLRQATEKENGNG